MKNIAFKIYVFLKADSAFKEKSMAFMFIFVF